MIYMTWYNIKYKTREPYSNEDMIWWYDMIELITLWNSEY